MNRLKYGLASIRFQLTLVVLAATLPMMIFVGLFANQQRQDQTREVKNQVLFSAKTAAMGYDQTLQFSRQVMSAIARLSSVVTHDPEACQADLDEIRTNYQIYNGVSVSSPAGVIWCSSPALPESQRASPRNQDWFRGALTTRQFTVGTYQIGLVSKRGNLSLGYPVLDAGGAVKDIVGLGINVDALNQAAERITLPEGAVLNVLDRSGAVIIRAPNSSRYVGSLYPDFELLKAAAGQEDGVAPARGLDEIDRLYGFSTLPSDTDQQLLVAVGIPIDSAYRDINSNLLRNLIAIASLALLGIAMSWIITERFILHPAGILTAASRRLTNGDLSARANIRSGAGELFELAQDFDEMADALEKQECETRALNQKLEQRVAERTQELSASRDLLQQFSNHLQNVLEEERKKISREIHDELGQALTGLKMDLRFIKKKLLPEQDSISQRIDTSMQLIDNTIATMRRISTDLRPGILDDLGLIPAVDWLVNNFQNRTGIEAELLVEPADLEAPKEMHISLYRIVQEALTNVMRHAQASQVKIKIQGRSDQIVIEVHDNGRGFDPLTLGRSKSLGLTGIRERAALIGANAEVIGSPGTGTVVIVHAPIVITESSGENNHDSSINRG